jgi:hypothetical protein
MNFFGHIINFKLLHERPRKKTANTTSKSCLSKESEKEEEKRVILQHIHPEIITISSGPSEKKARGTKLVNFSSSSLYDSSLFCASTSDEPTRLNNNHFWLFACASPKEGGEESEGAIIADAMSE